MAITPDTTWGGPAANAYLTLDEADEWIRANKVHFDEWELAKDVQRQAALYEATRTIDELVWHGGQFFWNQARSFPRFPPGGTYPWGRDQPDAEWPQLAALDPYLSQQERDVKIATCEQALAVLRNEGRDAVREEQFLGVSSVSRGARVSTSRGFGGTHEKLHPDALRALRRYRGQKRVVRGDA